VETALHGDYTLSGEVAYDEVSFVAYGGTDGEAGDLGVGEDEGVFDAVCERTEAASEYDSQLRLAAGDEISHVRRG